MHLVFTSFFLVLSCQLLGSEGRTEVYGKRCPDLVREGGSDPDRSIYLVAAQIERGSRRLTVRLRREQYEAQIMKAIETGHSKAFARLMDVEDEAALEDPKKFLWSILNSCHSCVSDGPCPHWDMIERLISDYPLLELIGEAEHVCLRISVFLEAGNLCQKRLLQKIELADLERSIELTRWGQVKSSPSD